MPGTREWITTDLAIADGTIAGWGPREAHETVDVSGAALTAAFVDVHMHLESTKLWVDEFVRAVLPHGTTAVAADPARDRQRLRRPGHRRPGRSLGQAPVHLRDLRPELCAGIPLREPGRRVLQRRADRAPRQARSDRNCRGHELPRCRERRPGGPRQDRDRRATNASTATRLDSSAANWTPTWPRASSPTTSAPVLEEAEEKRRKGMWIFIREGSASRNLAALIGTVLAPRDRSDRAVHRRQRAGHIARTPGTSTTARGSR